MQETGRWSPQVPEPSASILVLLRLQEFGSKQGPRAGGSNSRWTREGAKSGGVSSPTQLGFSHLCFQPLQRGERAPPVGHRGDVRATPGKVGRVARVSLLPGPPSVYNTARTCQFSTFRFPCSYFHANLVVPLVTTTTSKYLLSTYLCTVLCSGIRRHRRNGTGKPPCPSRVYGLEEDRRGRGQQRWRPLLVGISVLEKKINRGM